MRYPLTPPHTKAGPHTGPDRSIEVPRSRRPRPSRPAARAAFPPELQQQLDAIAENVKRLRAEKRWSQRALAKISGVNHCHLALIEGGLENVTIHTLLRLARGLGVALAAVVRMPRRTGGTAAAGPHVSE
jgi:DNA-binding Xre family transcriptional regulator